MSLIVRGVLECDGDDGVNSCTAKKEVRLFLFEGVKLVPSMGDAPGWMLYKDRQLCPQCAEKVKP